jgi:hypothetical protein
MFNAMLLLWGHSTSLVIASWMFSTSSVLAAVCPPCSYHLEIFHYFYFLHRRVQVVDRNIRNRMGPRTLPCGTLNRTSVQLKFFSFSIILGSVVDPK